MDVFCSQVESNLRDYLLDEAKKKAEASSEEEKKKKQEKKKQKLQEIKNGSDLKVAKKKKKQYEKIWYNTYTQKIANLKFAAWVNENKFRKDKSLKDDSDALNTRIRSVQLSLENDISNYRRCDIKFNSQVEEYSKYCKKIDPNFSSTADELWNTIMTLAENEFQDLKKEAQELAKKIAEAKIKAFKMMNKQWEIKRDAEKMQQKIAEIPLKIEDTVEDIKDKLDALLGRKLSPLMNPEKPEFDLDVLIAKMQAIINPLMASIAPLEAVAGKVPILGDLAGIMSLMSSSGSSSTLTKAEIKKMIPTRPTLPSNLGDTIKGVFDDIIAVAMQLPMICINVIFQMIDTIVGLFKQIAGIIGVPGIPYPLSLVPDCISAMPKIIDFVNKVPVLMYAAFKGMLIDKLTEAMAMSIPKPNMDMDALSSLIPEIEEPEAEKPTAKSKPETKNLEYSDVVKQKAEEMKDKGFDRTDMQRILKSYKEIYDGSKDTINKYVQFSGSPSMNNLLPTIDQIKREQGTPEDFKEKLDAIFSAGGDTVKYDKIKNTKSVVGAQYYQYEDEIKEVEGNDQVVLPDTI